MLEAETESARRYRLFREQQAAELAEEQAAALDLLYSSWTCGCGEGIRCADHGGPCREGETQSLQGGKNERNPSGATLIVMASIRRSFPDQADEIIRSLRWMGWEKFWSFERWNHFVGVELDGYIHS